MASSPRIPRTSMSCLKFSFFSYTRSCVSLLTKVLFAIAFGEACVGVQRSSLSSFTFVFIIPNMTTAFFPFISNTSPTLDWPLIFTGAPTVTGCILGVADWGESVLAFSFLSFFRSCFSRSFSILRAILLGFFSRYLLPHF